MALKIKEFDVNYITAVGGKSVNGLKFANFRYKNSDKFQKWSLHGKKVIICARMPRTYSLKEITLELKLCLSNFIRGIKGKKNKAKLTHFSQSFKVSKLIPYL